LDQKKVAQLPPLRTTLLAPDPEDPTSTILELDELWSFVLKKAHEPTGCATRWNSSGIELESSLHGSPVFIRQRYY